VALIKCNFEQIIDDSLRDQYFAISTIYFCLNASKKVFCSKWYHFSLEILKRRKMENIQNR
jgi:hypothetical protein